MAATSGSTNRIRIISNAQIRYEGDFVSIDSEEPHGRTITLANVCSFGTERRQTDNPIPARDKVYEKIKFRELDLLSVAFSNDTSLIDDDPSVVGEGPCAPVGTKYIPNPPKEVENNTPAFTAQHSYSQCMPQNDIPTNQTNDVQQNKQMNTRRTQQGFTRGRVYSRKRNSYQNYGKSMRGGAVNGQNFTEQYKEDYDIESANKVLAAELEKLEIAEKSQDGDNNEESINGSASGEDKIAYDKNKSFFDSLSSELMDRARGINTNQNRRNEQELNSKTFGVSRNYSHNHNYRRGGYSNMRRGNRGGNPNYMGSGRGGRWRGNSSNYRGYGNNRNYVRRQSNERSNVID